MDQLKWLSLVDANVDFKDIVPKRTPLNIPESHADLVFMAKLSEQAERFDEMVAYMRKIVKLNSDLSTEERNLLSMAYKNVIGSRRTSYRIAASVENKEKDKAADSPVVKLVEMYRKQFELEISAVCDDINQLLETYLIPNSNGGEAKVFFLKMKGDYHRYHAEIASGEDQKKLAHDVYKQALELANGTLAPTNPIRLGLVLNFSVFYYEILRDRTSGVDLARQGYNEASQEIDTLEDEDAYKEANLIMQLIRDNLSLWSDESVAADAA